MLLLVNVPLPTWSKALFLLEIAIAIPRNVNSTFLAELPTFFLGPLCSPVPCKVTRPGAKKAKKK